MALGPLLAIIRVYNPSREGVDPFRERTVFFVGLVDINAINSVLRLGNPEAQR